MQMGDFNFEDPRLMLGDIFRPIKRNRRFRQVAIYEFSLFSSLKK